MISERYSRAVSFRGGGFARRGLAVVLAVVLAGLAGLSTLSAATTRAEAEEGCSPTGGNRPICPRGAPPEAATFLDPTVTVREPENVSLGHKVYVGPFARLLAGAGAPIEIGDESNAQDNVRIVADAGGNRDRAARMERLGLDGRSGVKVGERVILAHGATVKGPARIGVDGPNDPNDPDDEDVFLGFGSEVDGAIVERNSAVGVLARVGPGVRLPAGTYVFPGKNIDEQRDTRDPAKVRAVTPGDQLFDRNVIEVNTSLAREYTRMFYQNASRVRGINSDPGNTEFNPGRNLPETSATGPAVPGAEKAGGGAYCDGVPTREPNYRNRIIGAVCLEDSSSRLSRVQGSGISLRADEGEPFSVGHIEAMGDNTTFHALEESELELGDNITYGKETIVHGGGRDPKGGGANPRPTQVEDDVVLKDRSVTFKSLVGEGATVGYKSAVINSEISPGDRVRDRTIVLDGATFGRVEW